MPTTVPSLSPKGATASLRNLGRAYTDKSQKSLNSTPDGAGSRRRTFYLNTAGSVEADKVKKVIKLNNLKERRLEEKMVEAKEEQVHEFGDVDEDGECWYWDPGSLSLPSSLSLVFLCLVLTPKYIHAEQMFNLALRGLDEEITVLEASVLEQVEGLRKVTKLDEVLDGPTNFAQGLEVSCPPPLPSTHCGFQYSYPIIPSSSTMTSCPNSSESWPP